jgi:hypothetical protein
MEGSGGLVNNVVNNGNILGIGGSTGGVGGIAGTNYTSTISNAINNGNVNGYARLGGIVGQAMLSSPSTIDTCINNGVITSVYTGSGTIYVGGIAGYAGGSMTNCENYGYYVADPNSGGVGYICGINALVTDTNNINYYVPEE